MALLFVYRKGPHMAVNIGAKGLQEVNLTIPQNTSLTFTVVHKDDAGHVIDHSGSTAHLAFKSKDGTTLYDLDSCCTCANSGIYVTIPASTSAALPLGKLNWDMIVAQSNGEQTRLCYGAVTIVDTYALDED